MVSEFSGGDVPPGHLDTAGVPPPAAGLDAGGLQCGGPDGDGVTAGDEELEHLGVVQSLHRLTVDVSHQVTRPQPRIVGRRAPVHLHDEVVDGVEVCVPEVNPDRPESEAEASGASPDDDGRLERVNERRELPARTGVPARGCAGASRALHTLYEVLVDLTVDGPAVRGRGRDHQAQAGGAV